MHIITFTPVIRQFDVFRSKLYHFELYKSKRRANINGALSVRFFLSFSPAGFQLEITAQYLILLLMQLMVLLAHCNADSISHEAYRRCNGLISVYRYL